MNRNLYVFFESSESGRQDNRFLFLASKTDAYVKRYELLKISGVIKGNLNNFTGRFMSSHRKLG